MKGPSFSSVACDLKKSIRMYEIYNNEICDNYEKVSHKKSCHELENV